MANCPKCGADLNADFGMVTCGNCRSISVIDFDGNVQLDALDVAGPPMGLSTNLAPTSDFDPVPSDGFNGFDANPIQESSQPVEPEAASFAFAEASQETASEDLSDIADFGNSQESSGKDGLFIFDVFISGIDTKELRESVRESLDDARFVWDVNEVMGTIDQGALELRQLNPVKATILVNRLKGLPLEIHWKQNSITQS
jgi:hypothetical protein